jgi:hypothetical protein
MRRFTALLFVFSTISGMRAEDGATSASLVIVAGAPGEKDYGESFARSAENWQKAGAAANARTTTIGVGATKESDRLEMEKALRSEPTEGLAPLWIVLVGHGTANANDAKFNHHSHEESGGKQLLAPRQIPLGNDRRSGRGS